MTDQHHNPHTPTLRSLLGRVARFFVPRPQPTVQSAFQVTFAALIILGVAAVGSGVDISEVVVTSDTSFVRSGDEFTITVSAITAQPTNAIDIQISYPEDQIEILTVDTGESVITLWTEDPYAEGGTIFLRGGVFRKGFLGEHIIARVQARAIETGSAIFATEDVTFLAGDGSGSELEVADTSDDVTHVHIANEDGTFVSSESGTLVGHASVNLITDLDGDGEVGFDDIQAFMSAWRSKVAVLDFNGDGKMTFRDFAILLADSFFK